MRIYGSSPLFSYVELIFRCKRLFILSVILGTVIASVMVASRATTYNASMVVGLSGDPYLASQLRNPMSNRENDKENSPSKRKVQRLMFWVNQDPEFLDGIAATEKQKFNLRKSPEEIAKDIRSKLATPEMLTDQFVQLKLAWGDKSQAEDILTQLFNRFHDKTVEAETLSTTNLQAIAKKQFDSADKKANALGKERVAYEARHYFQIPTMLGTQVNRVEQAQSQFEDARLELSDAQQRLTDINVQIQNVPKDIIEQRDVKGVIDHPEIALAQQYDDMDRQLKQLLNRYSAQHPAVIDLQKQMAALRSLIDEAKQKAAAQPQKPTTTEVGTRTVSNPEYRELMSQKRELERTKNALSRRVADLQTTLSRSRASILAMPVGENEWQRIDSDYQLADAIRKNRKAQLEQIRLDLERQTEVEQNQIKQEVPPKAEKADPAGKTMVLYALGPLLGIVVAFCFSLLLESLDHTLRTPVEVEKYLNKPVLAVIPKMAAPREGRKQLGGASKSSITS
jgi:capsular polysaccharide biosynthesis protein